MKLDLKTILIVGLIVVVIIFIMRDCTRPSEQKEADRKKQYETEVAILKAEKAEISSRQEATVKRYKDKAEADSLSLMRYNSENLALKKKVIVKRVYVQPLIDSIPTLRAFVELQDSLIQHQESRIDSLNAKNEFQRKLNEDLISMEYVEDKVEQEMALNYTRRIAELDKTAKKKQRGNKLWKTVSTILAGAVVVETVLIVAD